MIARRVSHFRRTITLAPTVAILLQLAHIGVSSAQEEAGAAETAAARSLAVEGVKLAQAGQCKDAVDKLDRSERLRHSAIVLGHLGECQVALGKWIEGTENLRKLLREPLPPEPSPALEQAHQRAAATLRDIKPRIPTLTVAVKGAENVDVTLRVDGKEIPDTMIGVPLPVDPGEHALEAEAPGFLKARATAKLEPSSKESLTLELKRDPFATQLTPTAAAASAPQSAPATQRTQLALDPAPPASGTNTTRILSYVSYGVGAAGLAAGIILGRSAMQDENSLSDRCPNKVCPPQYKDDLDAAKTKGLFSTIGFGVGAVGVALGTVLLITSSGDSSSQTGSTSPPKSAFRPHARIGLANVELGTTF